jgi:hypothetical protein
LASARTGQRCGSTLACYKCGTHTIKHHHHNHYYYMHIRIMISCHMKAPPAPNRSVCIALSENKGFTRLRPPLAQRRSLAPLAMMRRPLRSPPSACAALRGGRCLKAASLFFSTCCGGAPCFSNPSQAFCAGGATCSAPAGGSGFPPKGCRSPASEQALQCLLRTQPQAWRWRGLAPAPRSHWRRSAAARRAALRHGLRRRLPSFGGVSGCGCVP